MIHVGYILMEKKFSDIWTPNTIQMHFTLLVLALPLIWHGPQSKHHLFLLNLAWIWHCQILVWLMYVYKPNRPTVPKFKPNMKNAFRKSSSHLTRRKTEDYGGYDPKYPRQTTWAALPGAVQPTRQSLVEHGAARRAPQDTRKIS